jgi:hypothetical protein
VAVGLVGGAAPTCTCPICEAVAKTSSPWVFGVTDGFCALPVLPPPAAFCIPPWSAPRVLSSSNTPSRFCWGFPPGVSAVPRASPWFAIKAASAFASRLNMVIRLIWWYFFTLSSIQA